MTYSKVLSDYCQYAVGRVSLGLINTENYVSTENMIPNKGGIKIASNPPALNQTQAFQKNDVLVSNIRPYFKKIWLADRNGGCSNDVLVFRANEYCNSSFLYYLLSDDAFFEYVTSTAKGTKMPRGDKRSVMKYKVPSVSVSKQTKIASILSSLDLKIRNNQAINRNLFEQAKSTFESLYLSYPERRVGDLNVTVTDYVANGSFASLKENVTILEKKDYAYFIRNVDLKAKEFPRFVNQHSYEFLNKSKLFGGEVIISNVGDVGSVFLCPKLDGPMTLGNNMIMLTSSNHNNYLYLYFKTAIGQGKINGITGGSAQPKFNKTDFKSLVINYPGDEQVIDFNNKVSPLLALISKLDEENKRLSSIRDIILPKLMSGELDVSELSL